MTLLNKHFCKKCGINSSKHEIDSSEYRLMTIVIIQKSNLF